MSLVLKFLAASALAGAFLGYLVGTVGHVGTVEGAAPAPAPRCPAGTLDTGSSCAAPQHSQFSKLL